MPNPGVRSAEHLPSLDGLRAISIVLVLLGHLNGTRGFGRLPWIGIAGDMAHFGVVVFFVISGFLITGLLIKERKKHGRISLKMFYARRALRIFPASYLFIGTVAVCAAAGVFVLRRYDLLCAFTYVVNYKLDRSWVIGHLWSLSVEEQFYLLWPFTFSVVNPRRGFWAAAGFVSLGPLARIMGWVFLRHTPYADLEMFPMVADSLAAGCLLAIMRDWLEGQAWYLRLLEPGPTLALAAVALTINRYVDHYTIVHVFGGVLQNLILAVLIHRSVFHAEDGWGAFLNWKPVAFIGVLSYSLYLWQQPFLNRASTDWINAFPENLILAASAAMMSYLLVEKPLMKLRSRLRAKA